MLQSRAWRWAAVQLVLLAGLIIACYCGGAIRLREAGPVGDVRGPLGRAQMAAPGPSPGWELYGAPLDLYAPLGWLILAVVAAIYLGMVTICLGRERALAVGWWLLPITLATTAFFVLAYLNKPTISH